MRGGPKAALDTELIARASALPGGAKVASTVSAAVTVTRPASGPDGVTWQPVIVAAAAFPAR